MAEALTNRARVGGSGFTYFEWDGQKIALCRQISHQTVRPVAAPVSIHPLDTVYAAQIVTPAAASPGTLSLELYEVYGEKVWDRLGDTSTGREAGGLRGAVDIVDVFDRINNRGGELTVTKYIKPPRLRGKIMPSYSESYHNCVVTDVRDGESVSVETMEILKQVDVMYTHTRRGDYNPNVPGTVEFKPSATFG